MSVSNMYSPVVTEEYVREQLWKKIFSNQQSGHPLPMSFKRAGKGTQWTLMLKFSQSRSTKEIPLDIFKSYHCILIGKRNSLGNYGPVSLFPFK